MKSPKPNSPNNLFELEESATERNVLFDKIQNFSDEFLDSLTTQKAFHHETHAATERDSFFEIDKDKESLEDILGFFKERVVDTGLNPASGGHLGYIPGGGIYSSALGDYLAAVTNRYAGVFYASPGAVRMEDALINWTGKLMGYSDGFGGNLTSGGSIANLMALHTAKHHKNISISNVSKSVVYCTSQSHHSIIKALKIIGLETCIIREIPLDANFRISVSGLETQIKHDEQHDLTPFLIVANAGSTDVGAIDPLKKLSTISKKHNIWFHVDAAYGGFFMLTDLGKKRLKGIELADSVILDPHKGLFMPYGLGVLLVKNIEHLAAAHSYSANYMRDAEMENQYSPADLSPELSKHFRGLRMWLPLKLYGESVFSNYLNEKLQLTGYLYKELKSIGYKVICEPDLSVIAFRL
ncbi:pyridoxal phosphate-dependent decarboxylase family protein [Gelidibacter gilvus]|uniref:pyridoxal phosphate-dependent decarboxylase family protein n=1 Tax=Gelidibacter gilvus TaxID=59602 RepID=UPI001CB89F6A|nr:aminotransferase class V-fold PLP-dependent enzyme [Gelidibacter gilvus]